MAQFYRPTQEESGIDKFLRRLGTGANVVKSGFDVYNAPLQRRMMEAQAAQAEQETALMPEMQKAKKEATELEKLLKQSTIKLNEAQVANLPVKQQREAEAYNADLAKKKLDIQKAQQELAKGPEAKDTQYNAALFGKRAQQAEQVFNTLEATGYDRTSAGQGLMSLLPGAAQGGELKQQNQAETNFLTAVLRKESGAAISPEEFKMGEANYFPRVGDTPKVLEQKRQARLQAIEGLKAAAGPAWEQVKSAPISQQKAPTKPQTGPKPGDVIDGYVFKGGDPADQNNWVKQ